MEEQQKKKDLVKVATKLTKKKKIPDASKVKEHYDILLRSKD